MGAKANLAGEVQTFGTGMDPVVIRKYIAGIIGGRTLDVSDYPLDIIKAGHIVIQSTTDETVFKPMPLAEGNTAYSTLPSNFQYVGVVMCSKPKSDPRVGIMYNGEVNDVASPFSIDSIKSALKAALPTLTFMHD